MHAPADAELKLAFGLGSAVASPSRSSATQIRIPEFGSSEIPHGVARLRCTTKPKVTGTPRTLEQQL
jgi:hypothetical protein